MHHHPDRVFWIFWGVVFGPASIFFLWAAIFNAVCVSWNLSGREKVPSLAPIAGGLAGAAAMLLFPLEPVRHYAWLPLFLDVGCLPYPVILRIMRNMRARRRTVDSKSSEN